MEFRDDAEQESTPQLSDSVPEGEEHAEREAPQPAAYSYVCQIEACATTLITAYDKKCRTCAIHRKADDVLIHGELQRFCQKCSRFHTLYEFDEGRRNCRLQLHEHNRRQRRLRRLRRSFAEKDAPPPRHASNPRPGQHPVHQSQIDALLAAAASVAPAPADPSHQVAPAPAAPAPAPPSMSLTEMLLLQQLVERIQYDYELQAKVAELLQNVPGLGLPAPGGGGAPAPPPPPPPVSAAWAAGGTTHYPQPTRPANGQNLEDLVRLERALAAALGVPPAAPAGPPAPQSDNSGHK